MANVVLSDFDQALLILISLLLIALIGVVIYISCRKHSRLERRLWRDIERDFVIIGSPAHMAEIKKSESDLCQDLLSKPVRPSISSAPFPQSPPPAYHHFRKSNDDGSLVDVKI